MKMMSSDQQQAFHRKTTGALVLIVGILLIACLGFLVKIADLPIIREKLHTNNTSLHKEISIKGQPVCLSLKSGEAPRKCEFGIKTDKGEVYAINQNDSPISIYGEVGVSITEVSGQLILAGPEEKYDIVGTITTDV